MSQPVGCIQKPIGYNLIRSFFDRWIKLAPISVSNSSNIFLFSSRTSH